MNRFLESIDTYVPLTQISFKYISVGAAETKRSHSSNVQLQFLAHKNHYTHTHFNLFCLWKELNWEEDAEWMNEWMNDHSYKIERKTMNNEIREKRNLFIHY
jgi:hypothetical protein